MEAGAGMGWNPVRGCLSVESTPFGPLPVFSAARRTKRVTFRMALAAAPLKRQEGNVGRRPVTDRQPLTGFPKRIEAAWLLLTAGVIKEWRSLSSFPVHRSHLGRRR